MAWIISMTRFKQSCAILHIKPDMPLSAAASCPDGPYPGLVTALYPCTHAHMCGCFMSATLGGLGDFTVLHDIYNMYFVCLSFSGSREAAFVYAISSAGVVYALTRACSQGELKMCNCDPHKRGRSGDERGDFDWGGCSDNINYGMKFAKAFIDAKERTVRDARALMNLHNNRCGRTVSV